MYSNFVLPFSFVGYTTFPSSFFIPTVYASLLNPLFTSVPVTFTMMFSSMYSPFVPEPAGTSTYIVGAVLSSFIPVCVFVDVLPSLSSASTV